MLPRHSLNTHATLSLWICRSERVWGGWVDAWRVGMGMRVRRVETELLVCGSFVWGRKLMFFSRLKPHLSLATCHWLVSV